MCPNLKNILPPIPFCIIVFTLLFPGSQAASINVPGSGHLPNDSLEIVYNQLEDRLLANKDSVLNQMKLIENKLQSSGNLYLLGRHYQHLGTFYKYINKYLSELIAYKKSMLAFHPLKNVEVETAYLKIDLGNIFYRFNHFNEALKYYKQALASTSGPDDRQYKAARAVALNNIALVKIKQHKPDSAITYFEKALVLREQMDSIDLVRHSYTHLVGNLITLGKLPAADSLVNYTLTEFPADTASIWYQKLRLLKSRILIEKEKYQAAALLLDSLYPIFNKDPYNYYYPYLLENLILLEQNRNNLERASLYAEAGYNYSLIQRDFDGAIAFINTWKEIDEKLGYGQQSPEKLKLVSDLKDSLLAVNSAIFNQLLEDKLELADKQFENDALQSSSQNMASTIKFQRIFLAVLFIFIATLAGMFFYLRTLNKKLKASEVAQRKQRERIVAIINNSDGLILSLDREGKVELINDAARDFLKRWTGTDIRLGSILPGELRNKRVELIWKSWISKLQSVNSFSEVAKIQMKNDEEVFLLQNFKVMETRNGRYAGLILVGNDVTEEHKTKVQLSDQHDALAKSNAAKERLLSILAHDLKDAIYSAKSLSELVCETPDDFSKEELISFFESLHHNFSKTQNLLDSLLQWLKTQTGALKIQPEVFSLDNLLGEVIADAESKAAEKGITIQTESNANRYLLADREMIKTVLRNLIGNALKYSPAGSGKICLKAYQKDRLLYLHVIDNGEGINKEDQEKLLKKPLRFSRPGTANEQGTGFGLSLCTELLKLHGQNLKIKSVPGEGSDFYFTLPVADKNEVVSEPVSSHS